MALESRLELKHSQKLVLTPQLQMAIKLLQMPQLELSQTINQELIENPFLEELSDVTSPEDLTQEEKESFEETPQDADDTELSLEKLAYFSPDDYFEERSSDGRDLGYFTSGNVTHPSYEYFLSTATDLFEHLIWQLRLSKEPEEVREVAELIIGNIDEKGYLRMSVEEISELAKINDAQAARAAGCGCVLVETGYNEGEGVGSLAGVPGLDAIFATLAEAVQWILQRPPARAQDAKTQ